MKFTIRELLYWIVVGALISAHYWQEVEISHLFKWTNSDVRRIKRLEDRLEKCLEGEKSREWFYSGED